MKISTEQLRALQEKEIRRARPHAPSGGFSEFFTRQLETGRPSAATATERNAALSKGARAAPFSGIPEDSAFSPAPESEEEAAMLMDGMFATVEQYAGQLARGATPDLKSAYGLLRDLDGQIDGFKSRYPTAGQDMPELAAMLNELDVLAATEKFKLNRGDYL